MSDYPSVLKIDMPNVDRLIADAITASVREKLKGSTYNELGKHFDRHVESAFKAAAPEFEIVLRQALLRVVDQPEFREVLQKAVLQQVVGQVSGRLESMIHRSAKDVVNGTDIKESIQKLAEGLLK